MELKDSGNRRQFESGAVRDICEGKGRCDLLPLDVVGEFMSDPIFASLNRFQEKDTVESLYAALSMASEKMIFGSDANMVLEVAQHVEDGARKYGVNILRRVIPVHCYIVSATRLYLKWLRGDVDEPHDRAFCWNVMCAIWTVIHHPELDEYRLVKTAD